MAPSHTIRSYITQPTEIQSVQAGTARIGNKQVLPIDDLRIATRRIFQTLSSNPGVALLPRLGLSVMGSDRQYRRITIGELKQLVYDSFVLVRPQVGNGGMTRYQILTEADELPFWWPSLLQGRWVTAEVESFFPEIKALQAKILRRP